MIAKEGKADLAQQVGSSIQKAKKFYLKAKKFYDSGELDKAIEYCNYSIGENIKNPSALNLKGLILYLKGDIDSSKKIWKLNLRINKDNVSSIYLNNLRDDEDVMKKFIKAQKLYQSSRVEEAVVRFKEIEDESFNSINTFNKLAQCYCDLGDKEQSKKYVNKVLSMDKRNTEAKKISKTLYPIKEARKYIVPIICVLLLVVGVNKLWENDKVDKENTYNNKVVALEGNKEQEDKIESPTATIAGGSTTEAVEETNTEAGVPVVAIKQAIDSLDIYKLNELYVENKEKGRNLTEKNLLIECENILKRQGVQQFYEQGYKYIGENKPEEALKYLNIAHMYSGENYLNEHIEYFIGIAYKSMGDSDNFIKSFEEYVNKYPKGNYITTVLYDLSTFYLEIDLEKSKHYAEILYYDYSDSEMNNSVIKEIIQK